MIARMLAAKKDDERCQDLRVMMDQKEHSRFLETNGGLLVRVAPVDGAT